MLGAALNGLPDEAAIRVQARCSPRPCAPGGTRCVCSPSAGGASTRAGLAWLLLLARLVTTNSTEGDAWLVLSILTQACQRLIPRRFSREVLPALAVPVVALDDVDNTGCDRAVTARLSPEVGNCGIGVALAGGLDATPLATSIAEPCGLVVAGVALGSNSLTPSLSKTFRPSTPFASPIFTSFSTSSISSSVVATVNFPSFL